MGRVAILLACLAALTYLPAAAQGDADVKTYRLSMNKLRKLLEVQRGLASAHEKNPELFAKLNEQSEEAEEQNGGTLSMSQRAALMDRQPEVKRVLTDAGWTAHDYALTYEATVIASSGMPPSTEAEKANVTLLKDNAAESQKIVAELGHLNEQMTDEDSEE
jgi:hypothetical protein